MGPITRNASPPRISPKVVLLTGAAKNLGSHILDRLLQTPVDEVVCAAVRNL